MNRFHYRTHPPPYLQTGTVVGELPHTIEAQVDDLLADGVVAASVVVRGIFFIGDQLWYV